MLVVEELTDLESMKKEMMQQMAQIGGIDLEGKVLYIHRHHSTLILTMNDDDTDKVGFAYIKPVRKREDYLAMKDNLKSDILSFYKQAVGKETYITEDEFNLMLVEMLYQLLYTN